MKNSFKKGEREAEAWNKKTRQLAQFTKPYKVPLVVDNKKLIERVGEQASVRVYDLTKPMYDGEIVYQRNPLWITLAGGGEFQVMKIARREYPKGQILEIKIHNYGRYKN